MPHLKAIWLLVAKKNRNHTSQGWLMDCSSWRSSLEGTRSSSAASTSRHGSGSSSGQRHSRCHTNLRQKDCTTPHCVCQHFYYCPKVKRNLMFVTRGKLWISSKHSGADTRNRWPTSALRRSHVKQFILYGLHRAHFYILCTLDGLSATDTVDARPHLGNQEVAREDKAQRVDEAEHVGDHAWLFVHEILQQLRVDRQHAHWIHQHLQHTWRAI